MSEPQWLAILRAEVKATSQAQVAQKLRVSGATISQVVRGVYPSGLEAIKARVEGAYMAHNVACPILGEIPMQDCIYHQRRPFAATNPLRVQLYTACRGGCPHSRLEEKKS